MSSLDHVVIGPGSLSTSAPLIGELTPTKRVFLCADQNVMKILGDRVTSILAANGLETRSHGFPPGEASKSLQIATQLYDWLAMEQAERQEPIIALGGGVTGDLVGFVAATFGRGVPLIQIPTTLLAQIDSSIGGKVAVDIEAGKNLVGAFHPASLVIVDPDLLETLEHPQLVADYAEVIKTAVIFDHEMFSHIESSKTNLRNPDLLAKLVERCVHCKAQVVDQDPEDRGPRAVLNYGHTIAHAIETTSGYGRYRHGEAVSIGMVGAGRLSARTGRWPQSDAERQERLLEDIGLPTRFSGATVAAVFDAMQRDKKVKAGRIRWVLPNAIGHVSFGHEIDDPLVLNVLNELAQQQT